MRYLVVSDVHSNLEALQAVIRQAEALGRFDAMWSLRDIVGYGASPNACLDLLRSYPLAAVSGNHDLAVAGTVSVDYFNDYAKKAVLWAREQLTPDHTNVLGSTPLAQTRNGHIVVKDNSSLRTPCHNLCATIRIAQTNTIEEVK